MANDPINNTGKYLPIILSYFFILAVLIFFSCTKEHSCEDCRNKPPIAIAGPDQVITLPKDSTSLDGRSSSDPDGTISNFLWTKISGPSSFNIRNAASALTITKNLVAGSYLFELMVTDNDGLSAKDTVLITVDAAPVNHPPVANAGPDQTISLPTNTVTLDGSASTDPDNNITGYAWTKISGPSFFNIANVNAVQTQVINLAEGLYQFVLKVTDAGGLFSRDTMQVTVSSQLLPPPPPPPPCDNSNRPFVNAQLVPFGTLSKTKVGMVMASAGNKIVFAGGRSDATPQELWGSPRVDIYDIVTQTWSTAELSVPRWGIAAVANGNKIFFAGGEYGSGALDNIYSTVDIYDVSNNTWSAASLSEPRSYIGAAAVGTKVFFAGGWLNSGNGAPSGKVDIYDLSSDSWSTAQLSEPRAGISAVTYNNRIFFAGGSNGASPSSRIDIYDNVTNSWSISSLIQPMGVLTGIAAMDKICWSNDCKVEIKDVNTWNSSQAYLFTTGFWVIDDGQNAVLKNGEIIYYRHNDKDATKFDIYNISNNQWSIGVYPQKNLEYSSIISVNNTIYIAGGRINGVLSNQVWKLEF
ncbi:MAG: hypothetical protein EPN92_04905 [Chitinophagaceae bacterium]|nr:MAG: hypothetical protein EPN92_04905 [Chitinophagaceae bacterium]